MYDKILNSETGKAGLPILNPDGTSISSGSPFNLQVNKGMIPGY